MIEYFNLYFEPDDMRVKYKLAARLTRSEKYKIIRMQIFIFLLIIPVINSCSTFRSFRSDKDTLWKPQSKIKEKVFLNTVSNYFILREGDANYTYLVLPMPDKVNLLVVQTMKEINLFDDAFYSDEASAKLQVSGTIANSPSYFLISLFTALLSGVTLQIIPAIFLEKQLLEIKIYENKKEIFSSKKEETLMYYDSVWIDLFSNSKKAGDVQKRVMQEHTSQILKEFYDSYKSSPNFK